MPLLGPNTPKAAVIGDDVAQRSGIVDSLRVDFDVKEAADYTGAYGLLREFRPDILILDLKTASGGLREAVALLRELGESDLDTLVIVLSDDQRKSTSLRVMDAGAYDYFLKPAAPDILRVIVLRAVEKLNIERENRILREELQRKDALGELLGASDSMRALFDNIRRVARTATTVVIRGESGSGKELVARALHDLNPQRDRPFISVNCAALPETLMEAELFGYEKGAFTGAVSAKEGRIELAHRGTLFLDEIGLLSPALQAKLLRVLEEHTLVRLGGKKPIKVDFRLLTATNEDLEQAVREGRFREDLYYRIHVVPMFVPPLRERTDDIPLLADYFLGVYCAKNRIPLKHVSDEVLLAMKRYPWPGNVRELENVVQRLVVMTDDEVIGLKSLPPDLAEAAASARTSKRFNVPPGGIKLKDEVAAYERRWLEAALGQAKGVKAEAARMLGLNKDTMKYLCRKYDLNGH
jgi:DNA-binding NtrC family response regulator